MDKVAKELLMLAKELVSAETTPCPDCGTKVLDTTKYCVKCKKKIAKKVKAGQKKNVNSSFAFQSSDFRGDMWTELLDTLDIPHGEEVNWEDPEQVTLYIRAYSVD